MTLDNYKKAYEKLDNFGSIEFFALKKAFYSTLFMCSTQLLLVLGIFIVDFIHGLTYMSLVAILVVSFWFLLMLILNLISELFKYLEIINKSE